MTPRARCPRSMRKASAFLVCAPALLTVLAWVGCSSAQDAGAPVEATILAINDFHGNLMPPPGGFRVIDPADGPKPSRCPRGAQSTSRHS
jgi:5'-nucleotidase